MRRNKCVHKVACTRMFIAAYAQKTNYLIYPSTGEEINQIAIRKGNTTLKQEATN